MRFSDEEIRMDHRCSCPECDPRTAVHSQKTGPMHISVRWWDQDELPDGMPSRNQILILLDGVEISGVFEAVLGAEGSVWRYRGLAASESGKHLCVRCRQERSRQQARELDDGSLSVPTLFPEVQLCTERLDGAVELRAKPRAL